MHTKKIDLFAAADCIDKAYSHAVTFHNIVSAFEKTGIFSNALTIL